MESIRCNDLLVDAGSPPIAAYAGIDGAIRVQDNPQRPPSAFPRPPAAFPRPPAAFPRPPSAAGPGSRAGTIRLSAAFHRCRCACGEFRPFHRPNSRCAPAIKVAIGGISSGRAPDMATWHFPRRLIMLAFIVQLSATINSIIPTRLLCQSFIFFFSFLYIVINFDDFNLVIDCTYFQYDWSDGTVYAKQRISVPSSFAYQCDSLFLLFWKIEK